MDFLLRQFNQAVEMPLIALLQLRVPQHGAERRGKGQRETRGHAVGPPTVKNLDEREVSLRHRLKKPVFLEKFLVLRVAHKSDAFDHTGVETEG